VSFGPFFFSWSPLQEVYFFFVLGEIFMRILGYSRLFPVALPFTAVVGRFGCPDCLELFSFSLVLGPSLVPSVRPPFLIPSHRFSLGNLTR